jgi:pilus assembly protein CpaC
MNKIEDSRMQIKLSGLLLALTILIASAPAVRAQAENMLQVNLGESIALSVENVAKLAVADPTVADVVPLSDREISIIGKKAGVTTISIVRNDGKPTQMYKVQVGNDAAEAMIRRMISSPTIRVRSVGDTLILDGTVNDEIEAQRAAQVAAAYKMQVVNLLEVRSPRQIRIRTRVAEVNSDAVKNIGFRWFGTGGEVQYALDFIGPGSILGQSFRSSFVNGLVQPASSGTTPSSPSSLDIGADVLLQLLVTKGYAKLLSEPTLVTLSGKEASFLVGQEVPIVQQLPQSFTVEFKEVGVRMKVKPTADSQNQINTVIHAEVSQVTGSGALGLPIIGTKKADTTLQVRDGQTIVIGGLLENNISRDFLRKVPWLADIPLFGFLFRHKEFAQGQREVLFFMTPEIIKDVDTDTAAAAKTPIMEDWNKKKANTKLLQVPRQGYDWGLHNPAGMGIPGLAGSAEEPAPKTAAKAAAKGSPAAVGSGQNFGPGRQSGN